MMTLIAILSLYVTSILIGKRITRMSKGVYVILFLLAIAQTALMMLEMYSRSMP